MESVFAGIELGGTKCICILARGPDDILAREAFPTGQAEETLSRIELILRRWRSIHDISSVGIASFGPLDLDVRSPGYGRLTTTPKSGWRGVDLSKLAVGLPFAIDTDVNASALAEGMWGASVGLSAWSYITIGTGVGVGSIVNGRPINGLGHSEAGHMRVPVAGSWRGSCAFHGDCIEGMVSGPALSARTGLPPADIPDDHPVWEEAAKELGALCHNLVFTVLPQKIIFGGGVVQCRPHLVGRIREQLKISLADYASGASVASDIDQYLVPASLGENAGPLGAVALAIAAKPL